MRWVEDVVSECGYHLHKFVNLRTAYVYNETTTHYQNDFFKKQVNIQTSGIAENLPILPFIRFPFHFRICFLNVLAWK